MALAKELHRRGQRVSFITHSCFGGLIRRCGVPFIDLEDAEQYRILHRPDFWTTGMALARQIEFVTASIRKQYELVIQHHVSGQTVTVASANGLGARLALDKVGLPMASAYICPWYLRSIESPSDSPLFNLIPFLRAWDPLGLGTRLYFQIADRIFTDPLFKPEVNRLRQELGLRPVSSIFPNWMQSPQRIIGLFPDWFAHPVPSDWPKQTQLSQFPLEDSANAENIPETLRRFLDSGSAPIVFSPGSAMVHMRAFFATAINVCERLKRRALLLTPHREQIPETLPEFAHYESYVPFSWILPRAAGLVSHGGIGSASQGLAAGVPQLIVPMAVDQPDNARRLVQLGVARRVSWKRFHDRAVAKSLAFLLEAPAVRERCENIKALFPNENPVRQSCDLLEQFSEKAYDQRPTETVR
jgi:rhamnosyltransferase subunit B